MMAVSVVTGHIQLIADLLLLLSLFREANPSSLCQFPLSVLLEFLPVALTYKTPHHTLHTKHTTTALLT